VAEVAAVRPKAERAKKVKLGRWGGPVLVSPMAFWMLAFFLVPLILILVYSFGYQGVYDQNVSLSFKTEISTERIAYSVQSLHWYREIITNDIYWKAFWRTTIMVVGNTLGCLLLGFPLAYFISRKTGRRKTLFLLMVMIPFWTSFLIRTYSWGTVLGDQGLLNSFLQRLGLVSESEPLRLWPSSTAVWVALIYDYLPFMVLPLFVSIEKIDRSLFEASKDLGAGKWTTFRRVTLPLSLPGIMAGCMLVAIPTTGEFVIPAIAGGDKVVVWGWLIYNAFTRPGTWPMGAALSNILLLIMLIVVVLYVRAVGTEEF
jgi:ABC-type spermidine/putrescine transport system permease subunit I